MRYVSTIPQGTSTKRIIPCVELIKYISDFSPFAVVAVDKSKVDNLKKSVFARSVGFGGSFDGDVARLVGEGENVTYTLKPDEGFKVSKVTLNGKALEFSGDSVTLNYSDLGDRNSVEVHFIANSVAEYEAAQGITAITPCVTVDSEVTGDNNNDDNTASTDTPNGGDTGNEKDVGLIIAIVIIVVLSLGIVAALIGIIITKRQHNQE